MLSTFLWFCVLCLYLFVSDPFLIILSLMSVILHLYRGNLLLLNSRFGFFFLLLILSLKIICLFSICKVRFFFCWLVSEFLADTANAKRSKFLMILVFIFMTVAIVLRPLLYDPTIWLSWIWIVHVLRADFRDRQPFDCWLLRGTLLLLSKPVLSWDLNCEWRFLFGYSLALLVQGLCQGVN